MENKAEELAGAQQAAAEEKYRKAIDKEKVPIYGTLRVDNKPDDTGRFFGVNVNGLSFWQRSNYKRERLTYTSENPKLVLKVLTDRTDIYYQFLVTIFNHLDTVSNLPVI